MGRVTASPRRRFNTQNGSFESGRAVENDPKILVVLDGPKKESSRCQSGPASAQRSSLGEEGGTRRRLKPPDTPPNPDQKCRTLGTQMACIS